MPRRSVKEFREKNSRPWHFSPSHSVPFPTVGPGFSRVG